MKNPSTKGLSPAGFGRIRAVPIASAILGLLIVMLVISGCTMVGPDYVKPEAPQPDKWLESNEPEIKTEDTNVRDWWTVFHDPVLNNLIEAAYQQNLPLQIAGLRIYEARAQLGIAFGFQYPQSQFGFGSANVNQASKNAPNIAAADRYFTVFDIGLDAA